MTLRTHVGHSQDGGFGQLTLDREIEVLSVREPIMNVVSREIGHRLVNPEIQRLICRAARNRNGEREALSLAVGASVQPISEGLGEVNGTRTGPVQAEGSVSHFIEKIQVLNRRVVQAVRSTNAAFSRPAKELTQDSIAKARRVSEAKTRSKVVVSGRGKRLRNAWIAGI